MDSKKEIIESVFNLSKDLLEGVKTELFITFGGTFGPIFETFTIEKRPKNWSKIGS